MTAFKPGDSKYGYRSSSTREHDAYPHQDPGPQRPSFNPYAAMGADQHGFRLDDRTKLLSQETKYHDSEFQRIKSKEEPVYGNVLFPAAVQPSQKMFQSIEDVGRSNTRGRIDVKDEDLFLYGSELTSIGFSKDYMHGAKAAENESSRVTEPAGTSLAESQAYDSTIENILKSIGFNIDFSHVKDELIETEPVVEKTQISASIIDDLAVGLGNDGRNMSSKMIDRILSSRESYEERARRYREEQTRLYAEVVSVDSDSDVHCSASTSRSRQMSPSVKRSSLELLQSSYDYDKEIGRDPRPKQAESDLHFVDAVVVNSDPGPQSRMLYENFSDSDDNLSDSGRTESKNKERETDTTDAFKKGISTRQDRELSKEKKTITVEPNRAAAQETYGRLGAEKLAKDRAVKKECDSFNTAIRHVKVMSNASGVDGDQLDSNGGNVPVCRKAGATIRHVASKWDSPPREDPKTAAAETDKEPKSEANADPKLAKRRKAKLFGLATELDKLKQDQNELMRRKQRGKYGHKDPELLENSRLQDKISAQIEKLTKCTDEEFTRLSKEEEEKELATFSQENTVAALNSTMSKDTKVDSVRSEKSKPSKIVVKYDYFDDGSHWCRSCNLTFDSIQQLCEHLHSVNHRQKMDLNHRPWALKNAAVKPDTKCGGVPVPIKGVEFLMPTQAFFCSLCKSFSADAEGAHEHLKSIKHNDSYQRYVENDATYEHHYNLDKAAALPLANSKTQNSSAKRSSSATERADDSVKRTKPSSEALQKSSAENGTNETKSDAPPIPEAKSSQVKQLVKQVPTPMLQKSAVVSVKPKPAFIGKLPCLQTFRAKKASRAIGPQKALAPKAVNSMSSTAGGSDTNMCATKTPGTITADLASTAGPKATLCSSDVDSAPTTLTPNLPWLSGGGKHSDSACSKEPVSLDTSSAHEPETPMESSFSLESRMAITDSDTIEEAMLGDFEIFDECDAD